MLAAAVPTAGRAQRAVDAVVKALAARFGNRLVTSQAVREKHANTVSWIASEPPDAVVFPQTTSDVQEIVGSAQRTVCRSFRSAPAPRWKGTSTRLAVASRSTSGT
jgi:D-lactate dehydrogenase (cytochrome)